MKIIKKRNASQWAKTMACPKCTSELLVEKHDLRLHQLGENIVAKCCVCGYEFCVIQARMNIYYDFQDDVLINTSKRKA